jgi:trigger factor
VKVTDEKIENRQVFLTVEMEPAEVEESLKESYHRLVKKADIPGFRKGKAPRVVLERYIGKESLLENALNSLLPEAYEKVVRERKIETVAQPRIELTQTDPVVFKAVAPLPPVIELGDYHQIRLSPQPVELAEENVDAVIDQLHHQQATWESVERAVNFGDLVVLDVDSNIEGNPFINQEGVQYQVLRDLPFPVPGFAEQLPGMKRNEEKEFKLQFPPDYSNQELAGKESSFKVEVTEIKQEKLPELNDDFATGINPDFKTLDSLREQVSADLKLRAEEKARIDFEERAIEEAVKLARVEFPPILVEVEIKQLLDRRLKYQPISNNKTEEEVREELRPLATRRVTQSLVLGKIAQEEKIKASNSEIKAEIKNMMKDVKENKDEIQKYLDTQQSRESIEQLLIARKTIQRLVEIAKSPAINSEESQKEEPK